MGTMFHRSLSCQCWAVFVAHQMLASDETAVHRVGAVCHKMTGLAWRLAFPVESSLSRNSQLVASLECMHEPARGTGMLARKQETTLRGSAASSYLPVASSCRFRPLGRSSFVQVDGLLALVNRQPTYATAAIVICGIKPRVLQRQEERPNPLSLC